MKRYTLEEEKEYERKKQLSKLIGLYKDMLGKEQHLIHQKALDNNIFLVEWCNKNDDDWNFIYLVPNEDYA